MPEKIYQYLSNKQQQHLLKLVGQDYSVHAAHYWLSGLMTIPDYPLLTLLPHIEQIVDRSNRLKLLDQLASHLAPEQVHLLEAPLHRSITQRYAQSKNNTSWDFTKTWTENIIVFALRGDLKQIEEEKRVYQHIDPLIDDKISLFFRQLIQTTQQLTIPEIMEHDDLIEYCVRYFNLQQMQAALDYIENEMEEKALLSKLIRRNASLRKINYLLPYLNQNQLDYIFPILVLFKPADFVSCYITSYKHHQEYTQKNYYQTLLKHLSHSQTDPISWVDLSLLHTASPYLEPSDLQNLLQQYIQQLHSTFAKKTISISYESVIAPIIELLQATDLLNPKIVLRLLRHASQQQREECLVLLKILMLPYLQTLEPDQAQQLASQINHSIEQVCACWP